MSNNKFNNKKTDKKKNNYKRNNYSKKRKQNIPKKIREQVWLEHNNNNFDAECKINWCSNIVNVFNYQVGHNIPESKGGTLALDNLYPICDRCNLSMSNKYTIDEWNLIVFKKSKKNKRNMIILSIFLLFIFLLYWKKCNIYINKD